MKKELFGLALATSIVTGCANQPPYSHPETDVTPSDVYNSGKVVQVALGESRFINTADPEDNVPKDLIKRMGIVQYQYSNGPEDDQAPIINSTPQRINVQVALGGDSPSLANDAACDTLRVDGQPKYIGAVALGGKENGVLLSRPANNPNYAYICSFQHMEPLRSNGVVIFTAENDR